MASAIIYSDNKCHHIFNIMDYLYIDIFTNSFVDEESSIYYGIEFVRKVMRSSMDLSYDVRYILGRFLLLLLSRGLGNGIFQKRSTSRSRIISCLNELNLNLFDLLSLNRIENEDFFDEVRLINYLPQSGSFNSYAPAILAYVAFASVQ